MKRVALWRGKTSSFSRHLPLRKRCVLRHHGAQGHGQKGGWAGKRDGGCGGLCPPHAGIATCEVWGVWGALPPNAERTPLAMATRLSCRGRQMIPKKGGMASACECDAFFGTSLREAAAKRAGGRAKTWGVWPPSARQRGGALGADAPRTCQRQNVSPHMKSTCQMRGVWAKRRGMWGAQAPAGAVGEHEGAKPP